LAAQPALTSTFVSNASSRGIASSATIARIHKAVGGNDVDVVIFGAPDRSIGAGLGSGRLFALNAQTGVEVWKSPELAVLEASPSDRHEQIGYSSPLVLNDRVYIGIADHGDNPIQNGKVVAVRLSDGSIDGGFNYQSTSTRGGGVWSTVAGGPDGELYITTGNAQCWNPGVCQPEPKIDHSLSLLRLDPTTGAVIWKLKPVPFDMDGDPDWASGPAFAPTACGPRVVSTMKDGWAYAVRTGDATPGAAPVEWQFPNKTIPFTSGDGTVHGDTRYLRPGAAWESVFITTTGGERVTSEVTEGYTRLHGLNICAGRSDRVRWLLNVPNTSANGDDRYRLGAPTVTKGIVFVTTSEGHLIIFADQSAYYPAGFRCSNWNVSNGDCVANGFPLVAEPTVLANITLDGSQTLTEPALAGSRVYVATGSGKLYMLEP
jgi:outer membrane protein assembly factor BamB